MIKIDNLTIRYDEIAALDQVSLELPPGKIYGLIGPNGAGKSTLIKACAGLIDIYEGSVFFEGKEIRRHRSWQKEHCSYAPEDVELLPYLKGQEFLQLIGRIRNSARLEEEIRQFNTMLGLAKKEDELIVDFSHGMRQKIAIAAALIGNPKYLLFDETLNGLDTRALNNLRQYMRKIAGRGKTILLSSHVLPLVRDWCDEVIVLEKGRVKNILPQKEVKQWKAEDFPF